MRYRRWILGCFALFLCSSSFACGGWTLLEDVMCPPQGTQLTYENFGKAFFASYCDSCHGANSTARRGAPIAYIFDTHEAIVALKNRIFLRSAANNTTMPPGPDDPPKAERDKLAEWLVCGAPKASK